MNLCLGLRDGRGERRRAISRAGEIFGWEFALSGN